MNATLAPSKLTVTGYLADYDGKDVEKGKFQVYDTNNRYLARGKTSPDGRFKVELPVSSEQCQKIDLIFRLCKEEKVVSQHPEIEADKELAKDFAFYKAKVETESVSKEVELKNGETSVDVGRLEMEFIYEKETVPFSYMVDIGLAAISSSLTSAWQTFLENIDIFDWHTVEDVQRAYGEHNIPLTSENTWKLLTNGICPIYFQQIGNHLVAEINWDRYDFDKFDSLPNVKVFFNTEEENKIPELQFINIQFRKTLEPSSIASDKGEEKLYRPEDPDFEVGLRIVNSVFHVYGQTTYHLALGHVYGAKVSQTVHDYLQGTKLGEFLLPHCQFIRKISNELGKAAIFGEEGVLNASALSVKGIARLIDDTLAAHDPFSFRPRKPIGEGHQFARAQNLHFNVVSEAVAEYFDKNWEAIALDWNQVHHFFRKLHKTSPAYRPWAGVPTAKAEWRDSSEIGGLDDGSLPPRTKYSNNDTHVKSFRYIARDEKGPGPGDREMMERFVTDFIHHVTLWHSWIHRTQYSENGIAPNLLDLNFAPITLNNGGIGAFGGITETEANKQLKVGKTFQGFPVEKYALVSSENVYPGLIERIKANADKYFACGIDPFKEIQISTVI